MNMNKKAEFAVKTLKEYDKQIGIGARNTSDLSPLEQWLIIELFLVKIELNKKTIDINDVVSKLKDKKITDLLNWVKSDLTQETNVKLGKTATPYRSEKLKFLNKLLEIESL